MAKLLRKQDKVDLLARLSLFENCTRRDLARIASITVEAERPAGTLLTREGREGGLMFVLVDGAADVVTGDVVAGDPGRTGAGKVIGRLQEGDVVGELSLIDGRSRSASVVATTPVRVLEIAGDDFRKLVHSSPSFVRGLLRALSLRVRRVDALSG